MRKLATAAAVSLALASGGAFGLGLGDIQMRSALNQPMNAEIPLTSVKSGELDGMIVKLADEAAFTRAGIERSTALTDLQFTVDSSGGRPVIRITSGRAVTEPFLNFLLEVDWPQGRMVREYTVLLDPPVFMAQGASTRDAGGERRAVTGNERSIVAPAPIERSGRAAAEAPVEGLDVEIADNALLGDEGGARSIGAPDNASLGGGREPISLTDPTAPNTEADARRSAAAGTLPDDFEVELVGGDEEVGDDVGGSGAATGRSAPSAAPSAGAPPGQVTVANGDTLYEIARENAVEGVSVERMMLALLEADRSAFINDNINLVKAGAILRVPAVGEANARSQAQALAEISRQDDLWRQYRDNLRGTTAGTRLATGPTDSGAGDSTAPDGADTTAGTATDGLSEDARRILESAREEIRGREELSIVAGDTPAASAGDSAAGENEGEAATAARLGEINRRLQLAREELVATRVEGSDLGEQADALQSTNENLDALVTLRQNQIAQLEAQLAEARAGASDAAAATEGAVEDAASAIADAGDAAADRAGQVIDTAGSALGATGAAAAEAARDAANGARDALDPAAEGVDETLAAAEGALDADADPQGAPDAEAATAAGMPWYRTLLEDPDRLAIAGAGAVGLLGMLGALFWRRRRRDDEDETMAAYGDENVEFAEAVAADGARGDDHGPEPHVATAGAMGFEDTHGPDSPAASEAAGVATAGLATANPPLAGDGPEAGVDDVDEKDDTISEADVYIAYGLHGQAADLLTRAMERKPDNVQYHEKLLQTYHAQGNAEGYREVAAEFHERFGGESNPAWKGIAERGRELAPGAALFAAGAGGVAALGTARMDGPPLEEDDFFAGDAGDGVSSSISRDFGASEETLDFDMTDLEGFEESMSADGDATVDETANDAALLDHSIDPAFAFDESDLEATGDFSLITGELAAEDEETIDFPGFEEGASTSPTPTPTAGDVPPTTDALSTADVPPTTDALSTTDVPPTTDAPSPREPDDQMPLAELPADGAFDDALTLDEFDLDGTSKAANDGEDRDDFAGFGADIDDELMLDLDEVDLDATSVDESAFLEGLDEARASADSRPFDELEMPDLSSDEELLNATGESLDDTDEMDTMMDLAKAYIDMGDKDSASNALGEIVKAGNPEQISEAETLLRKIS